MTDSASVTPTFPDPPGRPTRRHRVRNASAVVLVIAIVFVGVLVLKPIGVANAGLATYPATSYEDATARYAQVQQRESADGTLNPVCYSRLIDHGARTSRVIVLFHGYTNCPAQYHVLADELAQLGYTVYIPLMPHHGELDREHTTLDQLTAEQLASYADDAVDIAQGLGDQVIVLGLSGGGTAASYVAQYRDDVDLAVSASPYLGIAAVPDWLSPALVNLVELLPPIGLGESASSASDPGIYAPYAAYDNNTRSAAAYMQLAQVVLAEADRSAHRAGRTIMVVNEADPTVNLPMIETLQSRWSAHSPATSDVYRFDAALGLPHDLIGPDRNDQRIDTVYPELLRLLSGG